MQLEIKENKYTLKEENYFIVYMYHSNLKLKWKQMKHCWKRLNDSEIRLIYTI